MKKQFLIMLICIVVLFPIKVSANQQNIVEKDDETRYYANYYEPYFGAYSNSCEGAFALGCPIC